MKIEELRELTSTELRSRGRELKHEVLNLRIQKATGQLEDRFRVGNLRKENARIETILTERRKGITVAAKPAKTGKKKEKPAKKAEAKEPKAEKNEEKAPAKKAAKKATAKAAKKE
jgi:large subunit ribosomal protein L29